MSSSGINLSLFHILFCYLIYLLIFSCLCFGAALTERDDDPTPFTGAQMLRLVWHSSVVLGDSLYIDGGEMEYLINDEPSGIVTMNDTLSINLSYPFDNSGQWATISRWSKPQGAPILLWNALWPSADSKLFFNFGGVLSGHSDLQNPAINIWQYTPSANGGNYSIVPSSDTHDNPSLTGVRPASALSASGNGIGYALGGWNGGPQVYGSGGSKDQVPVSGLLIYNSTSNTWTNRSANAYSPYGTALNGRMHFLPDYGSAGLLVMLGGEFTGLAPWFEQANNLIPFTNITLYDLSTDKWYSQIARGATGPQDIPPSVVMFCSVFASAPESGTVEIIVFGGHSDTFTQEAGNDQPTVAGQATQAALTGVYVLSLPGFVWFKANDSSAKPRTGHTCERIGSRSMVSVGGMDPSMDYANASQERDAWFQSIGVLDMVNLNWTNVYNPADETQYTVPPAVADWYSDPLSNASLTWDSAELKSLLLPTSTSSIPSTTPSINPSSPQSSTSTTSSSSTAGLIAGAVVGCVAGVALLALAAFILYRQRRRSRRPRVSEPIAVSRSSSAKLYQQQQTAVVEKSRDSHPRPELDGRPTGAEMG